MSYFTPSAKNPKHIFLLLNLMSFYHGLSSSARYDNRMETKETKSTNTSIQNYLDTTFDAESGSYGNMFDIRALVEIQVEGFDFHVGISSNANYDIFTKPGSYLASKSNPDNWSLIASGTVEGKGLGVPTSILEEEISPVTIKKGEMQAFYVTLETFDLRYSYGTAVGKVYASNNDIQIMEGSGVAEYPFGEIFYSPRVWNGGIRYTIFSTSSFTQLENRGNEVVFSFLIKHSVDVTFKNSEALINTNVKDALIKILWDDTKDLKSLTDSQFSLLEVNTVMRDLTVNDPLCNVSVTKMICSIVDIHVTFSHDTSVSKEAARSSVIIYEEEVLESLDFLPVVPRQQFSTAVIISLSGSDLKKLESNRDWLFFEEKVMQFLNDGHSVIHLPLKITFVKILSQNILETSSSKYAVENKRKHEQISSLDILSKITGEYNPTTEINLVELVKECFDNGGDLFVQTLKKNDHFKNFLSVKAHNAKRQIDDPPLESVIIQEEKGVLMPRTLLLVGIITACIIVFLSFLGVLCHFSVRNTEITDLYPKCVKGFFCKKGKNSIDEIRQADVSATYQELGSTRRGSLSSFGGGNNIGFSESSLNRSGKRLIHASNEDANLKKKDSKHLVTNL